MASNPYAAPTSIIAGFVDQTARFRRLARRRDAFLAANIGYSVMSTLPFLGVRPVGGAWVVWIASSLELLTFVAFAIPLLGVIAGAHRNATAIKGTELPFSSMALGASFFVPVANLMLPFLAMRTLWRASAPSESPASRPRLLAKWWALWVGSAVFAVMWRVVVREDYHVAFALSWCATVFSALAAVFAYRFLTELEARQRAA